MYNFAIMCPYKNTYLLHSISILPSKYILRWKYILRNKNQLNLLGIRSSVGILALPFRPLYNNMSLLSFLLFLRDSHFNCPRMPVISVMKSEYLYSNVLRNDRSLDVYHFKDRDVR